MGAYWFTWIFVYLLLSFSKRLDYKNNNGQQISHSKYAKVFYGLAVFVLIFVTGCRYYIGSDYYSYFGDYKYYADSHYLITHILEFDEPVIRIIYWIVVKFFDSGIACVFVTDGIIIAMSTIVLFKNSHDQKTALLLYVFTCWLATFNGMRQALAVAFVFCGYKALKDRNFKKYLLLIILATLCHRSAIVMIILFFTTNKEISAKNIIAIVILSIITLMSYDYVFQITGWILNEDSSNYIGYWTNQVNIFRILANVFPAVVFLLLSRKKKSKDDVLHLNLLIMNAATSVVSANSACIARMTMYTIPFMALSITELLKGLPVKNKYILKIIVLLLFGIFSWYEIKNSSDLSPFRWIWQR